MNHHPITKMKEHFPELPLVSMQTTALSLHLKILGVHHGSFSM
jgi:hypothetical protein